VLASAANSWTAAQTFGQNTNFPGSGIWNTSGQIGIGTTTPNADARLDVNGKIHVSASGAPEKLRLSTESAFFSRIETLPFQQGQSYAPDSASWHPLVINHDGGQSTLLNYWTGYVGIGGGVDTGVKLTVNGWTRHNGRVGINTVPAYDLHVNGSAAKPGGGSWTDSSDARLKHDVRPLEGALSRLLRLRGVTYRWNEPEKHGNLTGPQVGLIAQEVEQVFPEWIGRDDQGYRTLTIRGFEALTVESLRELRRENDQLRARLDALEARAASGSSAASTFLAALGLVAIPLVLRRRRGGDRAARARAL
jgi:hypothetical protein